MVGKIALVTGGASGIGKATAQRLAAGGAQVALADLNEREAAQVAQGICAGGGQAIAIRLDVTSETDWQAAMARVLADWGRLDIRFEQSDTWQNVIAEFPGIFGKDE